MRFDVITLFPEIMAPMLAHGVNRRAFDQGLIAVRFWNPRDYASGNYRRVDDRPFGGGPGMVMMAEPLAACLTAIRQDRQQDRSQAPLLLFSPMGERLTHDLVDQHAQSLGAILLCGRYEGIDQRFIDREVDGQISLGDFVLSGGELAAMALLDAVARLQPGVLGDDQSAVQDSFHPNGDGLLDCPHYTRPEVWQGLEAPAVLMSGHHADIKQWRRHQSLITTAKLRPDLIEAARAQGRLGPDDEAALLQVP